MKQFIPLFEAYEMRTIKFEHQSNPILNIEITVQPDGRIATIDNPGHMRFPFSVGQLLQRNYETWARIIIIKLMVKM